MYIESSHTTNMIEKHSLYESIKQKDWATVKNLLQSPDIKRLIQQNQNTLFMACTCVPAHIVSMIFSACPQQIFFKDTYGNTALHNALTHYSADTVEIVEFLLHVAPELARTINYDGMLPIHQAMLNRRSPEIVARLLEAYPEGLYMHNGRDGTSAQIFFDEWLDVLEDNIDNFERLQGPEFDGPEGNDFDIVTKTLLVIIEVHNALRLGRIMIPPVFTELMMKMFSSEDINDQSYERDVECELIESLTHLRVV